MVGHRVAWMLLMTVGLAACSTGGGPPAPNTEAPKSGEASHPTAPPKPPTEVPPANPSGPGVTAPPAKAGGASTSPAPPPQCIVIEATTEPTGLAEEGRWLHDRYPGWKKVGQALQVDGEGKHFDRVDILDGAGNPHSVCFDISSCFGKF
jgi:hypothetical protein